MARVPEQPTPEEMREHLARVLSSKPFRGQERPQKFLTYIVKKTLDDGEVKIKGFDIAVGAFGIGTSAPSAEDLVKKTAHKLRGILDKYYDTEGANESVRIRLPTGTYVPQFEWTAPTAGEAGFTRYPPFQTSSPQTSEQESRSISPSPIASDAHSYEQPRSVGLRPPHEGLNARASYGAATMRVIKRLGEHFNVLGRLLVKPKTLLTQRLAPADYDLSQALIFFVFVGSLAYLCLTLALNRHSSWAYLPREIVTMSLMFVVVPVIFSLAWLLVFANVPPRRILAGSCYVGAAYVLLSMTPILSGQLAIHLISPGCDGQDTNCDFVETLSDTFRTRDVEYPAGIEALPPPDESGQSSIAPMVSFTLTSLLVRLWLGYAWLGLKQAFSANAVRSLISFVLACALDASVGIALLLLSNGLASTSEGCGAGAPMRPTFNTWPLTYESVDCHDYPLIDVRNLSVKQGRSGHFSLDRFEHEAGITAVPGDSLSAKIYFNNGAQDSSTERIATHTKIRFSLPESDGVRHVIAGEIWADNAARAKSSDLGKGGDIIVATSIRSKLRFVPGSAGMCIRDAHATMLGVDTGRNCGTGFKFVPLVDTVFTDGVDIGSVPPSFKFNGFVFVELMVEARAP